MTNEEKWNTKYNELILYKEKNGDVEVSFQEEENQKLARWVAAQRQAYKIGKLRKDREKKLKEIGFRLTCAEDLRQEREDWEKNFNELIDYKKRNNNVNFGILPKNDKNHRLSLWCNRQRVDFRVGKINIKRKEKLEQIGFVWDLNNEWSGLKGETTERQRISSAWLLSYEMYIEYMIENNGDFSEVATKNRRVHDWTRRQIQEIKRERLTQEKKDLLKMISFNADLFEIQQTVWYSSFKKHRQYARMIEPTTNAEKEANQWFKKQSLKYREGTLSERKIKLLEEAGYNLDTARSISSTWLKSYNDFKRYNELNNGDLTNLLEDNPSMYLWFVKQKKYFYQKVLDERKTKLLLTINKDVFLIDKIDARWSISYEEFKKLNILTTEEAFELRKTNKNLYIWVRRQIIAHKKNELGLLKERALKSIGFKFDWFEEV